MSKGDVNHSVCVAGQSINKWCWVSSANLHRGQIKSIFIPLRPRLNLVGRKDCPSLHRELVYKKLPCFIHFILVHLWIYNYICMHSWDKFTDVLLINVRITLMNFILCFVNRYQRIGNTNKKGVLSQDSVWYQHFERLTFPFGNFGTFHSNIFALVLVWIPMLIIGFSFQILDSDWYLLWYWFFDLMIKEHSIFCLETKNFNWGNVFCPKTFQSSAYWKFHSNIFAPFGL
jgi:hypothetical protein